MDEKRDAEADQRLKTKLFMDGMIRIGLIASLVFLCFRLIAPFSGLLLWALIFATVLFPLQQKIASRLRGKRKNAISSILIVLAALLLLGIPIVMLGYSFATQVQQMQQTYESGGFEITPPKASVEEWPVIGEKIYAMWNTAAVNLPKLLEENKAQLHNLSMKVFTMARDMLGSVFLFLSALVIAGIMMTYGGAGSQVMERILNRLAGPEKGAQLYALSTTTVRSVASGVIGVAFIQALLLGVGFMLSDIPAAGVLAVFVMVLGVLQLPASIISLPAIAYLWLGGDASMLSNILFTLYLLVAGMVDNVLKPVLLGRGVDAPMPIILIGALGGMIAAGIIGLFVGAVVLTVGYEIFMAWVADLPASLVKNKDDAAEQPIQVETTKG